MVFIIRYITYMIGYSIDPRGGRNNFEVVFYNDTKLLSAFDVLYYFSINTPRLKL